MGTLFRVPATLPIANLKAQRGDKVGLQIMLAPDRVDCSTAYGASGQNVVCLDTENIPTIPIVSKRINFKVTAAMLAQRNTAAPTTTQVAQLSNAIGARDARKVRRLAVACPRLVYDGIPTPSVVSATASQGGAQLGGASASPSGNLQQTALEQLCHIRPQPKKRGWARQLFWWMDDDNAIDERFWKETAEVATVLIDYGADVNAGSQANRPPLWMLLTEGLVFAHRQKDAPPVALVETFLRRGANPNAADRTHTLLWDVTKGLYSYQSPRMPEVIECLVDNGVDVLATVEPFQQESVFDKAGSLQPDLATPILRAGRQRIAALEPAATLGVAEILADLRNADQETLLVLQDDLPCFEGTNWARMTRSLHESLGVGLDGIGPIAKTALTGRWAQAILPTGRQGDQAYLHVVLMRYPGGAYHAIRAFLTDTQKPTYTNSIEGSTRRISAAIEYALGHIDAGRASGQQSSSISGGLEALVVTNERGRLAVQTIQPSGWRSYYAELTPGAVLLWEDVWELSLRSRVVWETAPRQIVMKNGALTIRNGVKTLTFEVSGDQVRLQEPDGDRFGSEFRVDTETLDVQSDRQTP